MKASSYIVNSLCLNHDIWCRVGARWWGSNFNVGIYIEKYILLKNRLARQPVTCVEASLGVADSSFFSNYICQG